MKRFPIILTLVCVPVLVLLIGLGVWQMQRLQWKERLIARAEAAAGAAPAPLATVLSAADPEFRRALVVCPGLETATYVELQSIHDGQAGSRLVSACTPPGQGQTFLIDRGFVADMISSRPPVRASSLPLSILVEVRRTPAPGALAPPPSNGRFFARDGAAMAQALGGTPEGRTLSPFTLFALQSTNPAWQALAPSAPPAAFSNNHLGYAMTWFGLAIALVGFYVAMWRRRARPS